MPREVLVEEEETALGTPGDRAGAQERRRRVTVTLLAGTSGARSVTLDAEEVDGRSVRDVVIAAAEALRRGDIPQQTFADNVLHMFADSNTAVHLVLSPDQDQPLNRSERVSVDEGQPLTFALYTDHVGGVGEACG